MDLHDLLPTSAQTMGAHALVRSVQRLPAADIPDPHGPQFPPIPVPARLILDLAFPTEGFAFTIGDLPGDSKAGTSGLVERWQSLGTPVGVHAVRYNDLYPPPQDPELRRVVAAMWILRLIDEQGSFVDLPVGQPVMDTLTEALETRER